MAANDDSDRPLVHDRDQYEKRGPQFLAFCVIVTAVLLILIDAVAYFNGSTGAISSGRGASDRAMPAGKAMPVLP
jgi:hypothetical protein